MRLPRQVWVLGFVSLAMDVSSEMIHSVLPLFLAGTLGASALAIGWIEGLAEATALIVKVFSGVLSDWVGRRKGLAVFGYALGALSKPLFALATSVPWVLTARLTDRVGKGIRGAPRDALIADVTPPSQRGAAFGLRQTLDTIGAALGPIVAIVLLAATSGDLQLVLWCATPPAFLAVMLLTAGISEPPRAAGTRRPNPISRASIARLGPAYWRLVAVGCLFSLARFSEAFLVLRAADFFSLAFVPLSMAMMNIVYAAIAYPVGRLADRRDPRFFLGLGLAVLVFADVVLAVAAGPTSLLFGVGLFGAHLGLTQGVLAALIAGRCPADLRGTAFGVFNLVSGCALLVSSVVAGLVWDQRGPAATFTVGAAVASVALLCVVRMSQRAD